MNNDQKKKKKIIEISTKQNDAVEYLQKAKEALSNNNDEAFESSLNQAVLLSEKSTLELRKFVVENIPNKKYIADFHKAVAFNYEIKVGKNKQGNIVVKIPPLIPYKKKDEKGNEEYTMSLRKVLAKEFAYYSSKYNLERIDNCLIIINNIVSETATRTTIPDTDNYEYKALVNELTAAFLIDDSYDKVSLFQTSTVSEGKSRTEIILVPIINKKFVNPNFFDSEIVEKFNHKKI